MTARFADNSPIDLSRLKANLLTSGLQQKDNPLFQVINQLIQFVEANIGNITTVISGGGSGGGLSNASYLTVNPEGGLPNSKQELAGDFIAFDDSIIGERTISGSNWDVLTDGDLIEPELIYGSGKVIMGHTP